MKKILVALLSVAIIFSGMMIPVSATENSTIETTLEQNDIGYSQIAAEEARVDLSNIPNLVGVSNPTASAYKIDSAAGLTHLAALVNGGKTFEGITVYLANHIDMSEVQNQRPIGYREGVEAIGNQFTETSRAIFCGTLNGQGYAIYGINIDTTLVEDCYAGFIGWARNATLCHLVLKGRVSHTIGNYQGHSNFVGTGAVIGNAEGSITIKNVRNHIDVVAAPRQAGGFVGRGGNVTVTGSTNAGDVLGFNCAGGFFGFAVAGNISNSINLGDIRGNRAGGFIARSRSEQVVSSCVNEGAVVGKEFASAFVGAAENNSKVTVVSCVNYAPINGPKNANNVFGNEVTGTVTAGATNANKMRPGYSSAWITLVDLTELPNINTVAAGAAPSANAYQITDADGLIRLSELVDAGNDFKDKQVYLADDIDMAGKNMKPIGFILAGPDGTIQRPFKGTFDGQGYTISNLVMSYNTNELSGVGLFGCPDGATIQNFILDENCSFTLNVSDAYNGVGGVVGRGNGTSTIKNVMNKATVFGLSHSGGIIGRGTAVISYCTNYGDIYGAICSAGISAFRTGLVQYCANYGSISGSISGGVVARTSTSDSFASLVNYGVVSGGEYAGGVIGRCENGNPTLKDCASYGSASAPISSSLYNIQKGSSVTVSLVNSTENANEIGYSSASVDVRYYAADDIKNYDTFPNEKIYTVSDSEGLVLLAEKVNSGVSFAGVTIYVNEDIDMSGVSMSPIGYGAHAFSGVLDGQGNVIYNLNMSVDCSASGAPTQVALLGLTENATVKNLILDATCSFAVTAKDGGETAVAAALVAQGSKTSVINVWNKANVYSAVNAAGIVGRGEVSVFTSTNSGSIVGAGAVGGISSEGVQQIVSSVNYGTINGGIVGGITGYQTYKSATYTAVFNHGSVTGSVYAAGLVGAVLEDCFFNNCANYGAVGPESGKDIPSDSRYNVAKDASPAIKGNSCLDLTLIGYSTDRAENSRMDLDALIASGFGKNIEDYVHSTDNGVVRYLIIDSPEDMVVFSKLINTVTRGAGKTFLLANNINMSGYTFTGDRTMAAANTFAPIGWDQCKADGDLTSTSVAKNGVSMFFGGTFDGQGYTISGLEMTSASQENNFLGLFGYLNGATVKNLIIDESCSFTTGASGYNFKIGALAGGSNNSTVSNVWVRATVSGVGAQAAGLIGRCLNTTFDGCTNGGNVTGGGNVGGFGGFTENPAYYNCRNIGNIVADTYAGAFSGRDRGHGIYSNCINIGDVSVSENGYAGALAGYKDQANSTTLYGNCYNYGTVRKGAIASTLLIGGIADATGTDTKSVFARLTNTKEDRTIDAYHIDSMLRVRYQIRENSNGSFNLRLITTVDSLNYDCVGFHINYHNAEADYSISRGFETKKVYSALSGGGVTLIPSNSFGKTSQYFATCVISNIPEECLVDFDGTMQNIEVSAYAITKGGERMEYGHSPMEEIVVSNKLTATIVNPTQQGIIHRFGEPNVYPIGNTGVTVDLHYQAWPSVTVDENGTVYAFISARLEHIDPFGHTMMYKSTDGGLTWSDPILVNDTPMDDRDVGVTYMGNGKMLITYFRIAPVSFMTPEQSITSSDGVKIVGNGTYTSWQKKLTQTQLQAVFDWWETLPKSELSAGSWCLISNDYGDTWSDPISTPVSTPHGPILLRDGRLLYVGRGSVPGVGGDGIYAFTSSDGGLTWDFLSKIHVNSGTTYCEPHVVELSNGRLLVGIRVQGGNYEPIDYRIYTCYSDDGGETWTTPKMMKDAKGKEIYGTPPHLLQMENGAVVMTYASRYEKDRGEYAIISYDGGMTWDTEIRLSRWQGGIADIGYPATVYLGNGELVSVYYQAFHVDPFCSFLYTKWKLS